MKEKIYAIFSSVEDAKNAFGQVKKANWNKVDLSIVFTENQTKGDFSLEFAGEGFMNITHEEHTKWPGLREYQIEGMGKVMVGFSKNRTTEFSQRELNLIEKEKETRHLIGIIDAEPEILANVQLIMECCGGEVLFNQAET